MAKSTHAAPARTTATGPFGVGLIGTKFMGRAHSTAWGKCAQFFDLRREPRLAAVAGRNADETAAFAAKWGWRRATTDWRDLLADP